MYPSGDYSQQVMRGVCRTQLNIYGGGFLQK